MLFGQIDFMKDTDIDTMTCEYGCICMKPQYKDTTKTLCVYILIRIIMSEYEMKFPYTFRLQMFFNPTITILIWIDTYILVSRRR